MAAEERITFCRICESLCGLVATVEDGQVTKLRPDREHALSRGYACPKGIAMLEVHADPDRVLRPLRRTGGPGEFEEVTWDAAMADITGRLRAAVDAHGGGCVGWYAGNPSAFSYSHTLWSRGFMDALGSLHRYSAGSQDVNNRFAASALMYGTPVNIPIPDLDRTSFLLMIGANPLVSHGSVLTAPRIREHLFGITARGGRVVVADPRRTETARAFEHLPVRPDGDAWLLLSLLHVIFAEGLEDAGAIASQSRGVGWLREAAAEHPPEATAARTGVGPDALRALARDLAGAPAAAVYGRTGSCLGRYGTLVAFLIDAVSLVTGNLDRPGGAVFGDPAIELDKLGKRLGIATYGKHRSRIGGFPDVLGDMPATLMAPEIRTPGAGQLRVLFVSAGNPVLSVPDGAALASALGELDLHVSLDLYVNETNRHADYVLPATSFLERDDLPLALLPFHLTPHVQWSPPVVQPAGEAREEWTVIEELARAARVSPVPVAALRPLARLGLRPTPRALLDLQLRTGPQGDLFGLRRGGLSLAKLARMPHGVVTAEHVRTGVLRRKVFHRDKRVRLDPPEIVAEALRLAGAQAPDPALPLTLIGMRELRSHNSWMHNSPLLMRGGRVHALRVHPADAAELGLADGGSARITSRHGELDGVPVKVTDEMTPGTVALPHGWGHRGGWRLANANAGANFNVLAPSAPEDLEPLAGMAFLNGLPVRVAPSAAAAHEAQEQAALA